MRKYADSPQSHGEMTRLWEQLNGETVVTCLDVHLSFGCYQCGVYYQILFSW